MNLCVYVCVCLCVCMCVCVYVCVCVCVCVSVCVCVYYVCAGGSQTRQESSPAVISVRARWTGTGTSKEDIVRRNLLESLNSVATETISSSESPSAVAAGSKQAPPPPMPPPL